jgi:hypothetical protein
MASGINADATISKQSSEPDLDQESYKLCLEDVARLDTTAEVFSGASDVALVTGGALTATGGALIGSSLVFEPLFVPGMASGTAGIVSLGGAGIFYTTSSGFRALADFQTAICRDAPQE